MTGFLQSLKNQYRANVERHQNLPFLKATMAACALVATADGQVSFTERVRVDQIIETLEQLKVYDPHEAVDLFCDFADQILVSPKDGHATVLKELDWVKSEAETAKLLIRICLAVSESSGETSLVDQIEIVSLCSQVGIDPEGFGLYQHELLQRREGGVSDA
ncbi:MAG: TerB family tellurite resistance protein [Proteobacteria bacterium]|nr:TerB family tellurite resistance protein [Pseudomonadota bacterium]